MLVAAVDHLEDTFHDDNADTTPLDLALSEFRRTRGLLVHWIEPNLVRHIGLLSSIDSGGHEKDRDKGDMREYLFNYPI